MKEVIYLVLLPREV